MSLRVWLLCVVCCVTVALPLGCDDGNDNGNGGPSGTAPVITSSPLAEVATGTPYSYTVTATGDPAPTISFADLPAWLTASGATISGTPDASDVGITGTITVTASNGINPDAQQQFTIEVMPPTAPQFTTTPLLLAYVDAPYRYTPAASGPPPPTISASNLPGWLSWDGTRLTGTPSAADVGVSGTITLTASNGELPDATQNFAIEVISAWRAFHPTPGNAVIRGIWGSADDNIYFVGNAACVLHYDGTTFSQVPMPDSLIGAAFAGIWGSGADDIFVVGGDGVIVHFDGNHWSEMNSGTSEDLRAVWGSSGNNVFAVGAQGTIVRYNGSVWSPMTSGTSVLLRDVIGFGPNEVYAVGASATMLRYNGSTWEPMSPALPTSLAAGAIWGTSGSHLYVATLGSTYHFDGTSWDQVPPSQATAGVNSIWGAGPNEIYAGGVGTNFTGSLTHFDGNDWNTLPGVDFEVWAVWGSPSGNAYFGAGNSGNEIGQFTGGTWQSLKEQHHTHRFDAAWANAADDIFFAGSSWVVHYDGSDWTVETLGFTLEDVYGFASDDVYGVGSSGTIAHFDGNSWTASSPISTNHLRGVWGSTSDDVYAVGDNGTVLHYDGIDWSPMNPSPNTANDLYAIWGRASDDFYIVGAWGTIMHFNGTAWSNTPFWGRMTAVHGNASGDVFIVNADGEVWHYNGTSWNNWDNLSADSLQAIVVTPTGEAYAMGYADMGYASTYATIDRFNGTTWEPMHTYTSGGLYAASAVPGLGILAGGQYGTVLKLEE